MKTCDMTKEHRRKLAREWAEWCVPVLHAGLGVAAWFSAGLTWAPVLLLSGAIIRMLGGKPDGFAGLLALAGLTCACFGV